MTLTVLLSSVLVSPHHMCIFLLYVDMMISFCVMLLSVVDSYWTSGVNRWCLVCSTFKLSVKNNLLGKFAREEKPSEFAQSRDVECVATSAAAVVLGCKLRNCRNVKQGVGEQEHTGSANPLSWINTGKKKLTDDSRSCQ